MSTHIPWLFFVSLTDLSDLFLKYAVPVVDATSVSLIDIIPYASQSSCSPCITFLPSCADRFDRSSPGRSIGRRGEMLEANTSLSGCPGKEDEAPELIELA